MLSSWLLAPARARHGLARYLNRALQARGGRMHEIDTHAVTSRVTAMDIPNILKWYKLIEYSSSHRIISTYLDLG